MVNSAGDRGTTLRLIEVGKPNQNACIDSFNGRLWDECLNEHWRVHLRQARTVIEMWRRGIQRRKTEEGARRHDAGSLCETSGRCSATVMPDSESCRD
jgi:transposase InsO family protein